MSITPVTALADSIDANKDGVIISIPRNLMNADYVEMLGLTGILIDQRLGIYNAFPEMRRVGNSIVGIYSSGEGHGNSARQIMFRSDDGLTFQTRTFYENATLAYDATLLDGLMTTGQTLTFKVFRVTKTASGYDCSSQSFVTNNGIQYSIWGPPIIKSGVWLRTGYGTNGGVTETALLQSADGITWTFKAVMFSVPGRNFSEAALVECSDGSLFAVVREDGFSATRPLCWGRSTDGGNTWTAPAQYSPALINGTQPHLLRLADNTLLLTAGDRVGASGLDMIGRSYSGNAITGISAWRSSDALGASFSPRHMLAPMWSTDGGQPCAVQKADGTVAVAYYAAPASTAGTSGVEPALLIANFTPSRII